MALIGAILVEIKIIEILCERSSGEGDRQALRHGNVFHHHLGYTITSVKNAWRYQLILLYRYYRYRNYLKKYTKYSYLTQKTLLQLLNMFARYSQSLYSFNSAVKLVKLCLNHPYYKPSLMAKLLQTVQELLD